MYVGHAFLHQKRKLIIKKCKARFKKNWLPLPILWCSAISLSSQRRFHLHLSSLLGSLFSFEGIGWDVKKLFWLFQREIEKWIRNVDWIIWRVIDNLGVVYYLIVDKKIRKRQDVCGILIDKITWGFFFKYGQVEIGLISAIFFARLGILKKFFFFLFPWVTTNVASFLHVP